MANTSILHAKRILVYRLGSLGDTIVALPALRVITHAFPEAQRWMLTNFSVSKKAVPMAQVLDNTGLIKSYVQYPIGLHNPASVVSLSRRIRSIRPDILIYLAEPRGQTRIMRDAIFFALCGIRKFIGVPYLKKLQNPMPMGNGDFEYVGARLLRCLQPMGTISLDDSSAFDLNLKRFEHGAAQTALESMGTNRPFIAASIGAKVDVKDWGNENWTKLLSKLGRHLSGWGLAMVGSSDEQERTSRLLRYWPGKSLNLCNQLNVRESAAVLVRAKSYIGHDSGPMHLAAAVGTPCVAIFSSRNLPGEWFPHGSQHHIIYKRIRCMGCHQDVCIDQRKKCIRSISVDEVFEHVIQTLDSNQISFRFEHASSRTDVL